MEAVNAIIDYVVSNCIDLKRTNILLTSFFMLFTNFSGFSLFPLSTEVLELHDGENRFVYSIKCPDISDE